MSYLNRMISPRVSQVCPYCGKPRFYPSKECCPVGSHFTDAKRPTQPTRTDPTPGYDLPSHIDDHSWYIDTQSGSG